MATYSTANLTQDTAQELRLLSAAMTIATGGKRVALSPLISALVKVGKAHEADLVKALAELGQDEATAD